MEGLGRAVGGPLLQQGSRGQSLWWCLQLGSAPAPLGSCQPLVSSGLLWPLFSGDWQRWQLPQHTGNPGSLGLPARAR